MKSAGTWVIVVGVAFEMLLRYHGKALRALTSFFGPAWSIESEVRIFGFRSALPNQLVPQALAKIEFFYLAAEECLRGW